MVIPCSVVFGRRGGGFAVYVSSKAKANVWEYPGGLSTFDLLWVYIQMYERHFVIGALYHPPKPSYNTEELGLDRLEVRRLHFDLIYVYKGIFGMVEIDASTFFRVRNASTATRGHSFKLFVPQSRLDVRKYFFCHRVVRCWNSLPAQPDDFSLNNLKRLLERTDLSSFILFRD